MRTRKIGAALVLAAALSAVPGYGQGRLIACVAAIVNNDIITRADVDIADAFGLFQIPRAQDEADRRLAVLDLLIDQKLVLEQIRPSELTAVPDEAEAEWKAVIRKLGAAAVRERLDRFGLKEADVRPFLEAIVLFRRTIEERFSRSVNVSLKEIETHYAESYVPARTREGAAVRPLVEVLDAIEAELKRAKVEAQAGPWIETLRAQAEIEIRTDCLK